jgi:outer membrane protein TolC
VAVERNRTFRRLTLATQRQQEGIVSAWRNVFSPELKASYSTSDSSEEDYSSEASLDLDVAGVVVEPYIKYSYDGGADDAPYDSSIGVAISRDLFRIRDGINQRLPVIRATKDWHVALNTRIRELRTLQLNVTRAFYRVQNLRRRVGIRGNRVNDAREFLKAVRTKVENGFSPAVEETNARISLNQAQADLVRERSNLRDASEALMDLLGLPLSTALQLRDEDVTADPGIKIDLAHDTTLVLADHEDVRNKLLSIEIFRQERLTHLDDLLPELDLKLSTAETYAGDSPFSGQSEGDASVLLSFSMPLDGFRSERAQVRRDTLRLRELALELTDTRRDLEKRLLSRHRAIEKWNSTVALAEERLEAEERKLEATLKRYETGATDNLEVTRAKQSLDDAEVSLLDARINRIVAVAEYQSLIPTAAPADE